MRRFPLPRWSFVCLLGLFLLASTAAEAATVPFLRACVAVAGTDQICQEITFDVQKVISFEVSFTLGGIADIDVSGVYNTDPFVSLGVTTTNLVPGPVTYSFLAGTPIVPGLYNSATSQGDLTLTPGATDALVTTSAVYPTYISGYGTLGSVPTNLGVDLGTAPCSALFSLPPASVSCPQGATANTFPALFFDNLELLLTYAQSGLLSVVDFDARVDLTFDPNGPGPGPGPGPGTPAPEPATLLLLGGGMMAAFARRSRRHFRI